MDLKPGTRLRSSVCSVEVIVVKTPADPVDLRCGGHPMVPTGTTIIEAPPEPGFDGGSLLGKRYTDGDATIEVLCTKAGPSSLSVGDVVMVLKEAKPLPSSD
jgi:hypothetical protein